MNNKWKPFFLVAIILAVGITVFFKGKDQGKIDTVREVTPVFGNISSMVTSTAIVQPQNRLEIKPPINGRIEQILVREGEEVKTGDIIAWMSATERAALLDAARARGEEVFKYWEEVYKPTPLISPINGEVIVSTDEPGQTVTSADVVMVISDKLIVQAQVDETDIGRVAVGQLATISLDAYPEIRVNGKVDHIYYESKIVNNVTIYQVDIVPETVPKVFRSGMSATVEIVDNSKENVLLIPLEAVKRRKEGNFVELRSSGGMSSLEKEVKLGISDEKNVEVISGLTDKDRIVVASQKYVPPGAVKKAGTNPFLPAPRRQRQEK